MSLALVESDLPDGVIAIIRPDAEALKSAFQDNRGRAMTHLFLALTNAVNSGASVNIDDPRKIIVSKLC